MYGAVTPGALVTRQSAQVQVPCAPTRGSIVDPDQADVDLADDIPPVLDPPQSCYEVLERVSVGRGVLEPGEEVEGLAEVTAVVQAAGDRRQ